MNYRELFQQGFTNYARYFAGEVIHPHWGNYFYWLMAISAVVYALELLFPWRKNQPGIREDFWLDTFYMFFNFFLFGLAGYSAMSNVVLLMHLFTIVIGHLNHANLYLPLGPLKYLLNNPQMHIWHHSKEMPKGCYGVNYGLTISIWDYLFRTAWIPHDGRDIKLGFDGVDQYPHGFFSQMMQPFIKR